MKCDQAVDDLEISDAILDIGGDDDDAMTFEPGN